MSARTICMQFEGHSTTVADIVVDTVGKFAYTVGATSGGAGAAEALPIVMDVALDVRTKARIPPGPLKRPESPHGPSRRSSVCSGLKCLPMCRHTLDSWQQRARLQSGEPC